MRTTRDQSAATRRAPARDRRPTRRTLAQRADRHIYYERAVQNPPADTDFIQRTFRRLRGRVPRILREDFCGTAALCADWVRRSPDHRAFGIDLDEPTLNWGIRQHIVPLGKRAAHVELIRADVRDRVSFKCDAIAAFNFSYFGFKDRRTLCDYFKLVRAGLKPDGIFYLDLYGGPEAMELREERTEYDDFTYVWDQDAFNPITFETTCHIHFEFPDGSAMRRAFSYDWRLWQIPELEDVARDAGFADFVVYWEGTERKTGEGNGVYRPSRRGDNSPAYVAYLVAVK